MRRPATTVALVASRGFRYLCWTGAAFASPACTTPVADPGLAAPPAASAVEASIACEAAGAATVAVGAGPGRCPWRVDAGPDGLSLIEGAPGERVLEGTWPGGCDAQRCAVELYETQLGPALLVISQSPEAEVPDQVHFGRAQGGALRFWPLFHGQRVREVGTDLGPVYTLAPARCAEDWGWVLRARLGGAAAEGPDPALVAMASSGPNTCEDLMIPIP